MIVRESKQEEDPVCDSHILLKWDIWNWRACVWWLSFWAGPPTGGDKWVSCPGHRSTLSIFYVLTGGHFKSLWFWDAPNVLIRWHFYRLPLHEWLNELVGLWKRHSPWPHTLMGPLLNLTSHLDGSACVMLYLFYVVLISSTWLWMNGIMQEGKWT